MGKVSDYFPVHAHSEFSVLDGMGSVEDMVYRVAKMGQPALALTDHGTMAGVLRLYKLCKKVSIAPFPGSELYVVTDINHPKQKEVRYHMGMLALDFEGFKGMIALSSRSHDPERFHRKPLIDFGDLAEFGARYGKHVAVTTGCYFGLVVQTLVQRGFSDALRVTKMLAAWFPNLYVELQKHDIDQQDEENIISQLVKIADKVGLPVVLGQDSHYCDEHDQPVHDLMKDICYFGDGEDYAFPGGPYHLATTDWLRDQWEEDLWQRIDEGHGDLLDKHELSLPALDNYKFHVPEMAKDADADITMHCIERLAEWQQTGVLPDDDAYDERLADELHVITAMQMSNYFLMVQELCQWMRDKRIIFNARGSVNGSLVAMLMDITKVDPLQWGTSFDRFLSLERKKPPDIDLDVESGKRHLVLGWLKSKFPTLVPIGTYGRIGITVTEDGQDKGSVFVQYMAAFRRKDPNFKGKVKPEHRPLLARMDEMAVRKSLGTHAGGYVLGTHDLPVSDYLATALVGGKKGHLVTQAVMEDVEDVGYVKLDVLGVRALETMSLASENIGQDPSDLSWIPWDDDRTCRVLRSGQTTGIFQFEGWSTSKGGKEMGIRTTMDAIQCMALYRPALTNGGQKDIYLGNRKRAKKNRPYRLHPFFDAVLDSTYGVPIFQEQIMQMMQAIGMEFEDYNDLMKAVKASNDKIGEYAITIMARVKPIFIKLCGDAGIAKRDALEAWAAVVGFTDYGFNRAHATSYGIMAYRSAYLKTHYPLEYMHALLATWAGSPKVNGISKEQVYINEARRLGLKTARPHINLSGSTWTIDSHKRGVLRKGLTSVPGIGDNVAEAIVAVRPPSGFADMNELTMLVPARPVSGGTLWRKEGRVNGKLYDLQQAGALRPLGLDRE